MLLDFKRFQKAHAQISHILPHPQNKPQTNSITGINIFVIFFVPINPLIF